MPGALSDLPGGATAGAEGPGEGQGPTGDRDGLLGAAQGTPPLVAKNPRGLAGGFVEEHPDVLGEGPEPLGLGDVAPDNFDDLRQQL